MNETIHVKPVVSRLAYSPKIVGKRLRILLRENRVMQKEAAQLLEVTPSAVANYISGYRPLCVEHALVLSEHFHVRIEWLLNIGDNPTVRTYGGPK